MILLESGSLSSIVDKVAKTFAIIWLLIFDTAATGDKRALKTGSVQL